MLLEPVCENELQWELASACVCACVKKMGWGQCCKDRKMSLVGLVM